MILFCRINFNISKDSESKVEKRRVFFSCFSVQSTQITKILWLRNAEISKKKGRNYYRLEKYSLIMVALNCSLLSSFLVFFFFFFFLGAIRFSSKFSKLSSKISFALYRTQVNINQLVSIQ
ncbi:calmodulin-binding transcription activator 2-like [Sarcoptes scabiei]|nr:calmodulin-binding transcription activator 2-like [Sarcoptes scabiei]